MRLDFVEFGSIAPSGRRRLSAKHDKLLSAACSMTVITPLDGGTFALILSTWATDQRKGMPVRS